QKIGEILVLDAVSRASEMGCTMMRLGIVEENQVLRKWYEELGFTHTGTEKYDFFPFTCGYMSKDL
ncbi:MAG: GNAT family N-acetyltransferase, partial [Lachnospiraceae bacterium]|nr:GNAT family N-acetyltransferase [Lachnospiraceae bacterium]